jgi:hypothetical protein
VTVASLQADVANAKAHNHPTPPAAPGARAAPLQDARAGGRRRARARWRAARRAAQPASGRPGADLRADRIAGRRARGTRRRPRDQPRAARRPQPARVLTGSLLGSAARSWLGARRRDSGLRAGERRPALMAACGA